MSSYQVTVKVELLYDVEVEAAGFQDAVDIASEQAKSEIYKIIEVVNPLVPAEVLADADVDITGVYKL